MTWGWSINKEPLETGGPVGTPAEARKTEAWPDYEAAYLKKRLADRVGRFTEHPDFNDAASHVYLDKVSSNYKDEAEACLKAEFVDYLQGKHEANGPNRSYYVNDANSTRPLRRHCKGPNVSKVMENDIDGHTAWDPTAWGNRQLTHLPGVRDFLRNNEIHRNEAELQMNLLAEYGPQSLEEAWMYFKHWVKGRPVKPDMCLADASSELGLRSDFGWNHPGGVLGQDYGNGNDPPDPHTGHRVTPSRALELGVNIPPPSLSLQEPSRMDNYREAPAALDRAQVDPGQFGRPEPVGVRDVPIMRRPDLLYRQTRDDTRPDPRPPLPNAPELRNPESTLNLENRQPTRFPAEFFPFTHSDAVPGQGSFTADRAIGRHMGFPASDRVGGNYRSRDYNPRELQTTETQTLQTPQPPQTPRDQSVAAAALQQAQAAITQANVLNTRPHRDGNPTTPRQLIRGVAGRMDRPPDNIIPPADAYNTRESSSSSTDYSPFVGTGDTVRGRTPPRARQPRPTQSGAGSSSSGAGSSRDNFSTPP